MLDPNMELAYQLAKIPCWTSRNGLHLTEFKTPEMLAQFLDKHDKVIAKNLFKIYKALRPSRIPSSTAISGRSSDYGPAASRAPSSSPWKRETGQ